MKWKWPFILLTVLAAACAQTIHKDPSATEAAMKRWDDARSAVLVGLATDQYNHDNLDASRSTIDEALKLSPQSPIAHLLSARLYIEASKLEVAEDELAIVRRVDPTNAEADYLCGVIYQRWQQPERALECYQHACEKCPSELAYVMAKAEMLVAMNRRDEALALLQAKMAYFEHSGAIRDEVGMLLMQGGEYSQAVEMFRRASILAGDDSTIKEHLARALFDSQRYAESATVLADLARGDADGPRKRPDLLEMLGECQLQCNRPSDASQSFQLACEINPNSTRAWLGLARASMQLDATKRAESSLRKCLAIDPGNTQAYLLLGDWELRQSHWSQAHDAFARASQLDPSDATALCMLGWTLDKLGRAQDAAACYQQALKIRPDDELAARLMARISAPETPRN